MRPLFWIGLSFSITGPLAAVPAQSTTHAPQSPVEVLGPSYRFGDFDADGLDDVYLVDPGGEDRLLRNRGDGAFEDVTVLHGLAGVRGSRTALWWDCDGDGALDLYVSSVAGRGKLLQNTGRGMFVDVTAVSGLEHEGGERSVLVLDYDADGLPDLHVTTEQGDLLFHNQGRGSFARARLPSMPVTHLTTASIDEPGDAASPSASRTAEDRDEVGQNPRESGEQRRSPARELSAVVSSSSTIAATPAGPHNPGTATLACAPDVDDQATANCLTASSVPTLGMLYPLSPDLFVDGTGKVGLGTTSPSAGLHVTGVDGLLATGAFAAGTLPASGAGVRLMWYPRQAAFRAGRVFGAQWDDANIGQHSVALGENTISSAYVSTAMGLLTTASGPSSTAMGGGTTASGWYSTSMGLGTKAESMHCTALGKYNLGGGSPSSTVLTDPIFEVGIGTSSVGRANALTVFKNGNVGIGTTQPDGPLHVATTSAGTVTADASSVLTCERNGNAFVSILSPDASERGVIFGEPSDNAAGSILYNSATVQDGLDFRTNGNTTRMVVTGSGNVGIGTASPVEKLAVGAGVRVDQDGANTGTTANAVTFGSGGPGAAGEAIGSKRSTGGNQNGLDFYTAGANRLMITNAGSVGVGRAPTTNVLEVEGEASKTTAGNWAANSDRRIKTQIRGIENALETLAEVRPVAFHYTDAYRAAHPSIEHKDYYNVIAQEFAKVFPDYVKDSGEDGILQVDTYPALIHAIAAVQELHAKLEAQDEELRELSREKDARIAELQTRVERIESAVATLAWPRDR